MDRYQDIQFTQEHDLAHFINVLNGLKDKVEPPQEETNWFEGVINRFTQSDLSRGQFSGQENKDLGLNNKRCVMKTMNHKKIAEKFEELQQFYNEYREKYAEDQSNQSVLQKIKHEEDSSEKSCDSTITSTTTHYRRFTQEDDLILILKFLLKETGNGILWDIQPVHQQQVYAYIEENMERLYNLFESKLDQYRQDIMNLYRQPSKQVTILYLLMLREYGLEAAAEIDIDNRSRNSRSPRVTKGMFGIEFESVPSNTKLFSSDYMEE